MPEGWGEISDDERGVLKTIMGTAMDALSAMQPAIRDRAAAALVAAMAKAVVELSPNHLRAADLIAHGIVGGLAESGTVPPQPTVVFTPLDEDGERDGESVPVPIEKIDPDTEFPDELVDRGDAALDTIMRIFEDIGDSTMRDAFMFITAANLLGEILEKAANPLAALPVWHGAVQIGLGHNDALNAFVEKQKAGKAH